MPNKKQRRCNAGLAVLGGRDIIALRLGIVKMPYSGMSPVWGKFKSGLWHIIRSKLASAKPWQTCAYVAAPCANPMNGWG